MQRIIASILGIDTKVFKALEPLHAILIETAEKLTALSSHPDLEILIAQLNYFSNKLASLLGINSEKNRYSSLKQAPNANDIQLAFRKIYNITPQQSFTIHRGAIILESLLKIQANHSLFHALTQLAIHQKIKFQPSAEDFTSFIDDAIKILKRDLTQVKASMLMTRSSSSAMLPILSPSSHISVTRRKTPSLDKKRNSDETASLNTIKTPTKISLSRHHNQDALHSQSKATSTTHKIIIDTVTPLSGIQTRSHSKLTAPSSSNRTIAVATNDQTPVRNKRRLIDELSTPSTPSDQPRHQRQSAILHCQRKTKQSTEKNSNSTDDSMAIDTSEKPPDIIHNTPKRTRLSHGRS